MIILAAFDVARIAACLCKDGHGMQAFMQRYLAEIGDVEIGGQHPPRNIPNIPADDELLQSQWTMSR